MALGTRRQASHEGKVVWQVKQHLWKWNTSMTYSTSQQGDNGWWGRVGNKPFSDCRSIQQAAQRVYLTWRIHDNPDGLPSFRAVQRKLWHMLTWVNLTVAADSIGIHNVLEAWGELVGLVIGGWGLLGLHPIKDGRHSGAALLLSVKQHEIMMHIFFHRPELLKHFLEAMQTPWRYLFIFYLNPTNLS